MELGKMGGGVGKRRRMGRRSGSHGLEGGAWRSWVGARHGEGRRQGGDGAHRLEAAADRRGLGGGAGRRRRSGSRAWGTAAASSEAPMPSVEKKGEWSEAWEWPGRVGEEDRALGGKPGAVGPIPGAGQAKLAVS